MLPVTSFAHSGRTDSSGGHKDNTNKSGLGSYHYHCNGNPAHLHKNGCPYRAAGNSNISNSSSSVKVDKPIYKTTTAKVNIGGMNMDINGIIDNEMTLLEMRPLCDALGITINWDSVTSTANCSKENINFSLTIGTKSAKVNGQPYALERSPKVVGGKTMIPARFVAEAIGKVVGYDAATRVISIY
ncbi:MAG: copper amine oxidase N-terminal domain-containing protein [Cellulosilyticaceae bacterium]